MISIGRH